MRHWDPGNKRIRTKGAGGMLLASTSCGMLVQVLIQCEPSCRFSTASTARLLAKGDSNESKGSATARMDEENMSTEAQQLTQLS